MSFIAIKWALQQKVRNGTARAVLMALADRSDKSGVSWPSQATIGDDTGFTDRAVRKAMKQLEADGLIKRQKRGTNKNGGGRTSDLITLSMGEELNENIRIVSGTDMPVSSAGVTGTNYTGNYPPELPERVFRGTYIDTYRGLARKTKSDRFIAADIIPFTRKNEVAA